MRTDRTYFFMAKPGEKVRFTDTTASVLLDLVRGLAALLVLSVHLRNMLFVDYPEAIQHGASKLLVIPYVLSSGGHQAVVIFFVLSGYLVGGSVLRLLRQRQWQWRSYLLHRIVRLWIVLLPGLLLCFLLDSIGLRSHSLLYHGIIPNYETGDISQLHTIKIFFGNLFFLQPMWVPTYGSDGSLWSLSYEFWYYLLFPLGLIAIRREFSWRTRCACLIGFIASSWFVRIHILPLFPIWLLGVALTMVPAPRLGLAVRWMAAALYMPLIFVFSRKAIWSLLVQDYIFAIVSALFLWIMLSAKDEADKSGYFTRGSRGLSRFSYTLYVAHLPFLLLAASLLIGTQRWLPDVRHIAEALGLLVVALIYSYGIAAVTEYKTEVFRHWLERNLGIFSAPKAHAPSLLRQEVLPGKDKS
ncbi:acyltransferase family protein [Granulicella mallensis]|jgi:peptidoglycan/LPS O-acetylase OafA/YrhL|uniref:Acyltransferase 3 n=1 Tax=Granulicella mallensis (strain ATCC BAA-1857 / DSM 23137 / MP5ACTX8) TaxID=682795 RepID=G8P082_GRAMM|nr:acyltransferase [Granulicella mallensis]AEU36876.1 acyltransferase 3 [Granulicella mallensis MP5ACTX8]